MFTCESDAVFSSPRSGAAPSDIDYRDQALTEDIETTLAEHRSLAASACQVRVRGGVAHVQAQVRDESERTQLRRTIARVRGVDAVWDSIHVQGEPPARVLDIGCGSRKQHQASIGVDRFPHAQVDVVADLERGLPFADNAADHVFAVHFLEHVRELLGLMNEIHRVLKPSGVLHVMVPNCSFVNAVADPTHVRFFNQHTFKFFCRPYPGLRVFRPLSVTSTRDNVLADLQPVASGCPPPSPEELARCFR